MSTILNCDLSENTDYKYHEYIDKYLYMIDEGLVETSKEMKKMSKYIKKKLDQDFIFIDSDKIYDAVSITEKYFDIKMFPWERFIFAVCHIYDKRNDTVVFDEFFIEMGRGNGKNGFISMLIWYFSTKNHGINEYNIDIVANSEDQAKTSFDDIYNLIDSDSSGKLKRIFKKTKVLITNLQTQSYIKFNTSNASTKDGKRSACLVFDELHEYEDWKLINVFTSAFGKKKHSRTFYITTNGYVRGGVLDEIISLAKDVLNGEVMDIGMLPMIFKIDEKEEGLDPNKWVKANPSLPYLPELKKEMMKDLAKIKRIPSKAIEFFTKRMNWPLEDTYSTVATREQILATNQPIPFENLEGMPCIGAIDYASVRDFASVGLLFKMDDKYYLIEHTFVCHKALSIESREIKFPVREIAATTDLITIIPEDTIKPDYIVRWFLNMASKYEILDIRADDFRKAILAAPFEEVGLPLTTVRSGPYTHARLSPLVDMIFAEQKLILGDNPTMRWYINNVKQEMDKKGNITYTKIEPQLRKTDGFFMFLHGLSGESLLPQYESECESFSMKPIF